MWPRIQSHCRLSAKYGHGMTAFVGAAVAIPFLREQYKKVRAVDKITVRRFSSRLGYLYILPNIFGRFMMFYDRLHMHYNFNAKMLGLKTQAFRMDFSVDSSIQSEVNSRRKGSLSDCRLEFQKETCRA